ncbi:MAG: peptidoglycan editing factor PgeF [Rhizobiales bacterium]|nr:peptidoglycan editing factor PgeF [Hyphomicrobiales bacterium]
MIENLTNIGKTPCFQAKILNKIPALKHGFLTSQGGVSTYEFASLNCALPEMSLDNPDYINQNMNIVAKSFAISRSRLFGVKQVHEADVYHAVSGAMNSVPIADAIVTTQKGLALGIRTADCVPIILSSENGDIIGSIHAGWPSTYKGIVQNTVKKMVELGAELNQIRAAVGPAIAGSSYEVERELMLKFKTQNLEYSAYFLPAKRAKHYMFNLSGLVAKILYNSGIRHIEHLQIDTYENDNLFFSHRRATHKNHAKNGRQLSVIMIRD